MDAVVVLCGGMSRRMGSDKCRIALGHTTLLGHVLRTSFAAVDTVHVVGNWRQRLEDVVPEDFQERVVFAQDAKPDCGPLEGMRVGLASLPRVTEFAFVCGCDAPLLSARFISGLLRAADGFDAAVPFIDDQWRPLPAVYARSVLPRINEQLVKNERSLWRLVERLNVRQMSRDELDPIEPGLQSLINVNDAATLQTVTQIWAQQEHPATEE
jgi:molybdopterin-guanine dinucleotide biosynthesis protein A